MIRPCRSATRVAAIRKTPTVSSPWTVSRKVACACLFIETSRFSVSSRTVWRKGQQLAWHYDTNEFIVSLLTRKPEKGGAFEYVPDLRRPGDERYDDVERVLDGRSDRVRSLALELGDLQIFKGRFSLHRVVKGEGERHTVIFGYAKEPGFIGRVERTRKVHNRVTQAHIEAEKRVRNDGLAD